MAIETYLTHDSAAGPFAKQLLADLKKLLPNIDLVIEKAYPCRIRVNDFTSYKGGLIVEADKFDFRGNAWRVARVNVRTHRTTCFPVHKDGTVSVDRIAARLRDHVNRLASDTKEKEASEAAISADAKLLKEKLQSAKIDFELWGQDTFRINENIFPAYIKVTETGFKFDNLMSIELETLPAVVTAWRLYIKVLLKSRSG